MSAGRRVPCGCVLREAPGRAGNAGPARGAAAAVLACGLLRLQRNLFACRC